MPDTEDRHTLLFSATFPDKVQTLAKQFLRKDYLFIEVGIVGGACQDVEQVFIKVENNEAVKGLGWPTHLISGMVKHIVSVFHHANK